MASLNDVYTITNTTIFSTRSNCFETNPSVESDQGLKRFAIRIQDTFAKNGVPMSAFKFHKAIQNAGEAAYTVGEPVRQERSEEVGPANARVTLRDVLIQTVT